MIATHNIKVNGKWIRPGEEYREETSAPRKKAEPVKEEKPVEEAAVPEAKAPAKKTEAPAEESKAKSPARRKKISE